MTVLIFLATLALIGIFAIINKVRDTQPSPSSGGLKSQGHHQNYSDTEYLKTPESIETSVMDEQSAADDFNKLGCESTPICDLEDIHDAHGHDSSFDRWS